MSKLLTLFAIFALTSFAQSNNTTKQSVTVQVPTPELVLQAGDSKSVYSVAFSPDGKTLASGSDDNTIKLWEVATGTELRTLRGHSDRVSSIAFSPNGKTLASGSDDHTIKLWEVSTGTELRTLQNNPEHEDDYYFPRWLVTSVAFSPDGKTLASGSKAAVRLWDVSTGAELRILKEAGLVIRRPTQSSDSFLTWPVSLTFSPDGETLAISRTFSQSVEVWDVSTGSKLRTLKGYSERVNSVAFSPNGKTLATGSDDQTVKVWNVSTGTELRTLKGHSDLVSSVAFSPDGKTLASGSQDKTVKLWDVSTGAELRTLTGHSDLVSSVAFTPDGKTLASGSYDHTVKLWEVSTGKVFRTF